MTALAERLTALIGRQGPISILEFMTLALHDPAAGYYATREPIGAGGDFVTAPEVSQMFGELIGLWLAQTWLDQGSPKRPLLVELGPGRGTLMADALRALNVVPAFRGALDVVLVEASPLLQAQQRAAFADCGVNVRWVSSFADVGSDRPIFLAANEFFDALAIRQFVKTERGWCERMVGIDESGALAFALSPVPYPAANLPANRDGAPRGGVYEMSPAGESIAEEIGHAIATSGGAALIIDYGYDTPGFGETLQAVRGHQFADILKNPGASDLSAHVDFHSLGDAAVRGGASVCGPMEQGPFLLSLGLAERAWRLSDRPKGGPDLITQERLRLEVERLTSPEQMGTLFKALAIVPRAAPTPPGF